MGGDRNVGSGGVSTVGSNKNVGSGGVSSVGGDSSVGSGGVSTVGSGVSSFIMWWWFQAIRLLALGLCGVVSGCSAVSSPF